MKRATAVKQAVRPAHELPAGRLNVSMTNALTTAAHGLSLSEKRVMMFAVAKLNSIKADGGVPDGVIRLEAHDYAEQYGVDPNTAYEQLKGAGDSIFNRYIRFFEPAGKHMKEVKLRWVSRAEYCPGAGWIALRFTRDVAPHLVGLSGKLTSYKLAQASALRSIYSWRLLELLSQFKDTGWKQVSLDEFCHSMEATEKQRGDFAAIRRKIIEPAVKELAEKDGWQIEWVPIKHGRKVTDLRFTFKRDPQGRLDL